MGGRSCGPATRPGRTHNRALEPKPVETLTLTTPQSRTAQGTVRLWVEALTPADGDLIGIFKGSLWDLKGHGAAVGGGAHAGRGAAAAVGIP